MDKSKNKNKVFFNLFFIFLFFNYINSMAIKAPLPLENLGATCYMNASLQALYQVRPLTKFVLTQGKNYYKKNTIAMAYVNLIENITSGAIKVPVKKLEEFCKPVFENFFGETLETGKSAQQDASEFIVGLINSLASDDVKNKPNKTLNGTRIPATEVALMFMSILKESLKYEYLGKKYSKPEKREGHGLLALAITKSYQDIKPTKDWTKAELENYLNTTKNAKFTNLQKCLDVYFSPEKLTGEEGIEHEIRDEHGNIIGKIKLDAEKKDSLIKPAPYLILSLKRFLTVGGSSGKPFEKFKLNHNVSFSYENLDLRKYFDKSVNNPENTLYDLAAIVQHSGSLGSGHYTAYVLHNGQWYFCNDSSINPVPVDYMKHIANNGSDNHYSPYVLFYQVKQKKQQKPEKINLNKLRMQLQQLTTELSSLNNVFKKIKKI